MNIGLGQFSGSNRNHFATIAIYLIFLLLVTPTVWGKLHVDELYFLTCAYHQRHVDPGAGCYPLSIYTSVLSLFLPERGFVEGAILFKALNWMLVVSLPLFIAWIVKRSDLSKVSVFGFAVICAIIFYAASLRNIEIRPEFLAAASLCIGGLIGFSSYGRPSSRLILALLLLLLAASITPRVIPSTTLFVAFFILAYFETEHGLSPARIRQSRYGHIVIFLTAAFVVLTLGIVILNSPMIIRQLNDDQHLSFLFKFVISGLGRPLHLEPGSLLFPGNLVVFLFRPLMLILSFIAACAIFLKGTHAYRLSSLTLVFVPISWGTLLLLDPRPFSYVVILETSVVALVIWHFYLRKGFHRWQRLLAAIFLVAIVQGSIQANLADWQRMVKSVRLKPAAGDASLPTLLEQLGSNNMFVQLSTRRLACERTSDYEIAMDVWALLICRPNFMNFYPWQTYTSDRYQHPPPTGYFDLLVQKQKVILSLPHIDREHLRGYTPYGRFWIKG